jgi:hypothetical protein
MACFPLGLILAGLILLAAPISLGYNSVEKRLKVRWLGVTFTTGLGRKKPEKPRKSPGVPAAPGKGSTFGSLGLCWRQRDLVRELLLKLLGLALEICRTLSFRESEATISLPDPLWNGLLYSLAANINVRELNLSVNFQERNYAKIWVTAYPCRVMLKLAVFLLRFPYLRTIKLAWSLKKQRQTG